MTMPKRDNKLLIEAVQRADANQVELLLESGVSISCHPDSDDDSLLHYAVTSGSPKIVSLLLEYGVYANHVNKRKLRPADLALSQSKLDCLELLLVHGAQLDIEAYHTCAKQNMRKETTMLHRLGNVHSRDRQGLSLLHMAALYGEIEGTWTLLSRRDTRVNDRTFEDGRTPLHVAASKLHLECIQMLLSYGAKVNLRNSIGGIALQEAVCSLESEDPTKTMRLLLEHGSDVNSADDLGSTALHKIASHGRPELAKLLLLSGADPDIRDAEGRAPLHFLSTADCCLAEEDLTATLRLLISAGADVKAASNDGSTALHGFVERTRAECASLLLQHGADPNSRIERTGRTPLHVVAGLRLKDTDKARQVRVAQILLEAGADIRAVTVKDKRTAFRCAVDAKANSVVRTFIKHFAQMRCCGVTGLPHRMDQAAMIQDIKLSRYYIRCVRELESLRAIGLSNGSSVCHFVCAKSSSALLRIVQQPENTSVLVSHECRKRCKIYYGMLRRQFYLAMERKSIIDEAAEMLSRSIRVVDAKHIVTEKILQFLSIPDLKNLITAVDANHDKA